MPCLCGSSVCCTEQWVDIFCRLQHPCTFLQRGSARATAAHGRIFVARTIIFSNENVRHEKNNLYPPAFLRRLAAQCPTNVAFSTQAQADLFAMNYPGCDSIQGNPKIGPSPDSTDLSARSGLRFVKKNIVITGNSALTTQAGDERWKPLRETASHEELLKRFGH